MKAILEFNLPDDRIEFERINAVDKLVRAKDEISQYLRQIRKHGDNGKDVDIVVDNIYNILAENEVLNVE